MRLASVPESRVSRKCVQSPVEVPGSGRDLDVSHFLGGADIATENLLQSLKSLCWGWDVRQLDRVGNGGGNSLQTCL